MRVMVQAIEEGLNDRKLDRDKQEEEHEEFETGDTRISIDDFETEDESIIPVVPIDIIDTPRIQKVKVITEGENDESLRKAAPKKATVRKPSIKK
jgi:hypothetical protein